MKQNVYLLAAAVVLGLWLSVTFIHPDPAGYTITRSILQLSGSRGIFFFDVTLTELLQFAQRLVPCLVFQAFVGIRFYRHYCVASVYVFSRIPNRTAWYLRQVGSIVLWAAVYQLLVLGSALAVAAARFTLIPDKFWVRVFAFHFLIYFLWLVFTTLAVNLLAICKGSGGAFLWVAGLQAAFITVFSVLGRLSKLPKLQSLLIRLDPVSCLVLSWHTAKDAELSAILGSPYSGIYPAHSIIYVSVLCLLVAIVGGVVVARHDLLVSNTETGGN